MLPWLMLPWLMLANFMLGESAEGEYFSNDRTRFSDRPCKLSDWRRSRSRYQVLARLSEVHHIIRLNENGYRKLILDRIDGSSRSRRQQCLHWRRGHQNLRWSLLRPYVRELVLHDWATETLGGNTCVYMARIAYNRGNGFKTYMYREERQSSCKIAS